MEFESFLSILKRARSYGKDSKLVLIDGFAFSCYDTNDEIDETSHHHILIPTDEIEIFKYNVIIPIGKTLNDMNLFLNTTEELRKLSKIKPKDFERVIELTENDDGIELNLRATTKMIPHYDYSVKIKLEFINNSDSHVINTLALINKMNDIRNIKDSSPIEIRDFKSIVDVYIENKDSSLFYIEIEHNESIIKVPYVRSFLFDVKKYNKLSAKLLPTEYQDIYVYIIDVENNNIRENHISFIVKW